MVVLPDKAFLPADFRYIEDARTQVDSREFEIVMPDRTEVEVALELEFFMRAHGSEGTAFDTIAVSGTHPRASRSPAVIGTEFL